MRQELYSSLKIVVAALIAMSLFFDFSCKRSAPQPAKPSGQEPGVVKSDANQIEKAPSQPPAAPTADANHPAGPSTGSTSSPQASSVEGPSTGSTSSPQASSGQGPSASSGQDLVPIEIGLPKPVFVGTPQNRRVPNLEKPLGKARPPFYAPAGTKNVALGKPVLSSDEEPVIGELKMVTDGDKEAADGSFVELGPLLQNVTIDLQAVYEIYAIVVWHYHKQPQVYYDVIVQAASDPNFTPPVKTLFNNDIDNSTGLGKGSDMHYTETYEGKLIDAKGVHARYVRLYSNGSDGGDLNHYIEVEVYGKPVPLRLGPSPRRVE